MRIKNVNLFERYLHWVVPVLGLAFFSGVIWKYCLSNPYDVSIESGPKVEPVQLEEYLNQKGKALERALQDPRPKFETFAVPKYCDELKERLRSSPFPPGVARFDSGFGQPGLDDKFMATPPQGPDYVVPTPPQPLAVKIHADHFVLGQVSQNQTAKAWESLIGKSLPHEFHAVTVAAHYDMNGWRQVLRQVPDNQRVPNDWANESMLLVDIRLERQAYDKVAQAWGDIQVIEPLPGSVTFRHIPDAPTQMEAAQIIDALKYYQDDVARPALSPTGGTRQWVPPVTQSDLSDDDKRLAAASRIWAHDVTVKPGVTYRYRLTAMLRNPLFRRNELNPGQKSSMFDVVKLDSKPTPWSLPVTIDQETYYYVVAADKKQVAATIEVWRVFNGSWRCVLFTVRPGEMIGKVIKLSVGNDVYDVDFRINALMVDLDPNYLSNPAMKMTSTSVLVLDMDKDKIDCHAIEEDHDDLNRAHMREESRRRHHRR